MTSLRNNGLSKIERVYLLKVRQAGRLAFDLLNEGVLQTEVERVFGDLIVFGFRSVSG